MEALVIACLGAGLLANTIVKYRLTKQMRLALESIASQLNHAAIVDCKTWGELYGHPIHITATPSSKKYTIRIEFDGSSVRQLALANESTAEKDLNHFFSEEYEIGDVAFDRLVHIQGDPKMIAAVLGQDTRKAVAYLIREYGATIQCGKITTEFYHVGVRVEDRIKHFLKRAVACAQCLRVPDEEITMRIVKNIESESDPRVMCWFFEVFAESHSQHPQLKKLTAQLARSPLPEVCLVASRFQADAQFTTLRRLALDEGACIDVRRAALREASQCGNAAAVGELAVRCISTDVGIESARLIGIVGYRRGIQPLTDHLVDATSETAREIGATLTRLGGHDVERGLIRLLDLHPDVVDIAQVQTLGDFGTIASAKALTTFKSQPGISAALRAAADRALSAIRTRQDTSKSGGLGLVATQSGALSLHTSEPPSK